MNLDTVISRKQNTPNFPKNEHFLPLIRTRICAYQRIINVRFSENLTCFVFLKHPFWDSPFCLITDELDYACAFKKRSCRCESYSHMVYKVLYKNSFLVFYYQCVANVALMGVLLYSMSIIEIIYHYKNILFVSLFVILCVIDTVINISF